MASDSLARLSCTILTIKIFHCLADRSIIITFAHTVWGDINTMILLCGMCGVVWCGVGNVLPVTDYKSGDSHDG